MEHRCCNDYFSAKNCEENFVDPTGRVSTRGLSSLEGELSGEFSVRSAYKLLQDISEDPSNLNLQIETNNFYRKLWKLYIPSKVTLTIWRISWNFIPSLVNLKQKKTVDNALCPRCQQNEEDSYHIFQQCPRFLIRERLNRFIVFTADFG